MQKKSPRDLAETLRDEMYMRDKITEVLEEEPKTVVEIAEELNLPSSEVMQWVMSMRRYGKLIELPKDRADDYYKYQLRKE
jgi:predicted Rossmann fold nucleotide-binding protein DprA/Smf involved in DNA uptake